MAWKFEPGKPGAHTPIFQCPVALMAIVISPGNNGESVTPSTIDPPDLADTLKAPLKTATTPARPSLGQLIEGPASAGICPYREGGSWVPTCQRSSVVRACRRMDRKYTPATSIIL